MFVTNIGQQLIDSEMPRVCVLRGGGGDRGQFTCQKLAGDCTERL